jgi:hypothetical protein
MVSKLVAGMPQNARSAADELDLIVGVPIVA